MEIDISNLSLTSIPVFTFEGYSTVAKCVKVYDGDTIHLIFTHPILSDYTRFSCRMYGYNSAEIRTKNLEEKQKGIESRDYLSKMILDKIVNVHFFKMDKYGRPLIKVMVDGIDVNAQMIELGYGRPYDGTGRKDWLKYGIECNDCGEEYDSEYCVSSYIN